MPNSSLSLNTRGTEVRDMQAKLGKIGITVPKSERDDTLFGQGTRRAVLDFQNKNNLPATGVVDDATLSAINAAATEVDNTKASVEGRLYFDNGAPAAQIALRLYDVNFGGAKRLKDQATNADEIRTDADGSYVFRYDAAGKSVALELRAVAGQKEITLNNTLFNPAKRETLNVVVAADGLQQSPPEFARLKTDITSKIADFAKLATAKEDDSRRDLSVLYQETGWDTRLIALASRASARERDTGVAAEVLYGLSRVGLPTSPEDLARMSPSDVESALRKSRDAKITSLTDADINNAKAAVARLADSVLLKSTLPGGMTTVSQMLTNTGLAQADQTKFLKLVSSHDGTPDELWQKARAQGFAPAAINKLRRQGKLAYLTQGNTALMNDIQAEIGDGVGLEKLADSGMDSTSAWNARLRRIAQNDDQRLAALIPAAYAADTLTERVDAYAADLARQVRASFPTRVVGKMIQRDELRLRGANVATLKSDIDRVLLRAQGLGFEFGKTPAGAFLREKSAEVFTGIPEPRAKAAAAEIKRMQRLYQITPSNDSMRVLNDLGFSSSLQIARYPRAEFLERYGERFASRAEAALVYDKARQVSSVLYNFYTNARQFEAAAPLDAVAAPSGQRDRARGNLVREYPTIESLFGSQDYCECEHCRSVFSPAAYLVDLLRFIDPDSDAWESFRTDWRNRHNGKDYDGAEFNYLRPFDALMAKRPDLQHLPLTCENTHTALPYIDIVNEILEYAVVNGRIDAAAVHDTGAATSPELLAEPQNIMADAYMKLRDARYPINLPFDLWLEFVREFVGYHGLKLHELLGVFRRNDALMTAPGAATGYGWDAVFIERLGLSPAEAALFTRTHTTANWFELYGFSTAAEALGTGAAAQPAGLRSAKTLARRLTVSYKDLLRIVQTRFVNPDLTRLGIVWKLQLDISDVVRYFTDRNKPEFAAEKAAFESRLSALSQEHSALGLDVSALLNNLWTSGAFARTLVLRDAASGAFDLTTVAYGDGSPADDLAFLKINLFVRLWKKLGWSIAEVDACLTAFLPRNSMPVTLNNLGPALQTALIYLSHLTALDEQLKLGKNSKMRLALFWSDVANSDLESVYAQLFLRRSILRSDAVFDHPLGQYLRYFDTPSGQFKPFSWDETKPEDVRTGNVSLQSHLVAVQAALGLTANEIALILARTGASIESAALSAETLSVFYRHGTLAKALKLSIDDLISLIDLSGIDPFAPLAAGALAAVADDRPFGNTLRFVELVGDLRTAGIRIADLNSLLRCRFDPVGENRTDSQPDDALLWELSTAMRRIEAEHAAPADAAELTDDVLRQKLALILPADVAAEFAAMWDGTIEREATPKSVAEAAQLDPAVFAGDPRLRVSYDKLRGKQHVAYRGVLFDGAREALLQMDSAAAAAAVPPRAASAFLDEMLREIQNESKAFFDARLLRRPISGAVSGGFLDAGDYQSLFAPVAANATDAAKLDALRNKRRRLVSVFYPYLQRQLARQLVVQALTTQLRNDPVMIESLATDSALLSDPGEAGTAIVDVLATLGAQGVSAEFFDNAASIGKYTLANPDSSAAEIGKATPARPPATTRARIDGYIEPRAAGTHKLFLRFSRGAGQATLWFDHLNDPLIRAVGAGDGAEFSELIELDTGMKYKFTLELEQLATSDVAMTVETETLPRGTLDRLTLWPRAVVAKAQRARLLLQKALQFAEMLSLTPRELRYLLSNGADFGNLDLRQLPLSPDEDSLARATALFGQLLRVAAYTRSKREMAGGTDDLIDIFEAARRVFPAGTQANNAATTVRDDIAQRVATLTRRDPLVVQTVAEFLGINVTTANSPAGLRAEFAALTNEIGLWKLWRVLASVEQLGATVSEASDWLRIVEPPTAPTPRAEIARALKDVVKARYDDEAWQRVAKPIFDKLRKRQRDALVAYLLQSLRDRGIERVEQLFEHFLIDPAMEPVVQTSRLRLAIASVQLFIQRCLLNLEPRVHPSAIDAQQWQWLKRYRISEAAKKINLYAESFLEPEFRDDKTHLFRELEGALLQNDVTNDLVEDLFFNYLKKLDEIARLEIVSMYCEEKPLAPASATLHVIGRTANKPHKYFYRRYSDQMWTPWEPVGVDIDSDHVVAVIWRQRLHLFWLTFVEGSDPSTNGPGDITGSVSGVDVGKLTGPIKEAAGNKLIDIQLNWSELANGEWSTRESSGLDRPMRMTVPAQFEKQSIFVHASKEYDEGEEAGVKIHLCFPSASYWMDQRNTSGKSKSTQFKVLDVTLVQMMNVMGPLNAAFRVISRNSPPQQTDGAAPIDPPYSANTRNTTGYSGTGSFSVTFVEESRTVDATGVTTAPLVTRSILGKGGAFKMITCANSLTLIPQNIAPFVSPFFFQDDANTFYVEPSLVEVTAEKWERGPIIKLPPLQPLNIPRIDEIPINPQRPWTDPPRIGGIDPSDPIFDPRAKFRINPQPDWLADPGTLVAFGDRIIGREGSLDPKTDLAFSGDGLGIQPSANAGSNVTTGTGIMSRGSLSISELGAIGDVGLVRVIGESGLTRLTGRLGTTFGMGGSARFGGINQ